jgi:ATP-dependent DNA helicase RecG
VFGVANVANIEAGVSSQARLGVVPPVPVEFDTVEVEGKQVVIVTVLGLPSVDRPCQAHGRAYLKQSDGDYVMSEQETAQLVALQDSPRYDAAVVEGASESDLDGDLVRQFRESARSSSRRLAAGTGEA